MSGSDRDIVERFGKASGPLLSHKLAMFEDNDSLLHEAERQAKLYSKQPKRTDCKICHTPIRDESKVIRKLQIDYHICSHCGHLNGRYEDSNTYVNDLYVHDNGARYGANYRTPSKADYDRRVADIYQPKAEFLVSVAPEVLKGGLLLDLGCGSGHFASALVQAGVEQVLGMDVSGSQVELARQMVPQATFDVVELSSIVKIIADLNPRFVSMIGVLEHLQNPVEVLRAIRGCPSVDTIYLSVPTYSLSVLFEAALPQVFPRQLSGGHTHLFTEQSLRFASEEILGFAITGLWWFGTDIVDLYRSLTVMLGPDQGDAASELSRFLAPQIDSLQLILDSARLSSEVHAVLSRSQKVH